MRLLDQFVSLPGGVYPLLLVAALLEVLGDSYFQTAVHRSSGSARWAPAFVGAAILSLYGLVVNLPGWDFGKLLGVYVVFFFLAAQAVAWLKFRQPISLPVCVGGILIAAGGLVIRFWQR